MGLFKDLVSAQNGLFKDLVVSKSKYGKHCSNVDTISVMTSSRNVNDSAVHKPLSWFILSLYNKQQRKVGHKGEFSQLGACWGGGGWVGVPSPRYAFKEFNHVINVGLWKNVIHTTLSDTVP